MTARDQAYIEILGFGLFGIRENARLGHIEYCAIESEHLHNIPSLIGETNEHRHQHYIQKERKHYLERVNQSLSGLDFTLARHAELWPIIEEFRNEE